ncbi:hypothetical protein GGG17_05555 [Arsenicicoccus sp. MKL-02]|uniref:Uncharacterized protein n=1 Tax=Arsenicicoccus cauae TaxID=2663847 RepID=A0A6I3IC16_9MICO|nr:hypothetical protein [Arsenicicoccus cauae]MTB71442.1 hypothetical protein [Arsenicicoccus cauae]
MPSALAPPDVELERRSRREESMRHLKWAAELAVSDDERKAQLGYQELVALWDSSLLTDTEKSFITAAMAAIVRDTTSKVEDAEERGEGVVVVLRPPQEGSTPQAPQTDHPGTP